MKLELEELDAEFERLERKKQEADDLLWKKYGLDQSEDLDATIKKLSVFPREQVRKDLMTHRDIMDEISKEYDRLLPKGERIKQKAARMGIRYPGENNNNHKL